MNTMKLTDMNEMIQNSVKDPKYTSFALYDKTNEIYVGNFETPEMAIDVANSIRPYNCKVLWVVAVIDECVKTIPFYLLDYENDYCKADTRIALFEVYEDARVLWKCNRSGVSFDTILMGFMNNYDGYSLTGKEFVDYLNVQYSFNHETAIKLIVNILQFAKGHYDDNESAVSIAKWMMRRIGIDPEDMDLLKKIK